MNAVVKWLRQLLLTVLILLCAAWASGEGAQWLLRWRAQRLLTDIRSLEVNRSGWSDAQAVIKKWGRSGTSTGSCTSDNCIYRINLVQTLPPILVGYPDEGVKNWLPRIMDHIGLRSAAARAGFTVERGTVTSAGFGEQVTLPVRDWGLPSGYVPYLSVFSGDSTRFHEHVGDRKLLHPNRMVWMYRSDLEATFSPEEDPAEQAALMDFRFSCITQLRPCESEGEILPEAVKMLQER